jgi:hypothetical protein
MENIENIFHSASPHPIEQPEFRFEFTEAAANHNLEVLVSYGLNLRRALKHQANTPLQPGSEFKSPALLEKIFADHPLWPHMSRALSQGASFPLAELSPEDRNADIQYMLQYVNHKSAKTNSEIVNDLLREDIERGFALTLPLQAIHGLTHKRISISPLGCQEQDTINKLGEVIKKNRLTHDQSFPGPSGNSPNIITQSELLPPCKYGHCIKRIINYIISLRL